MKPQELLQLRMNSQQMLQPKSRTTRELVRWMGAMQSQDFGMAKWAIGLRLDHVNHSSVEADFNSGAFLRTHVLRPTWHFVAPEDIRWMLKLTGARVHATNTFMMRKVEVDAALIRKCNAVFEKALAGGKFLRREELGEALAKSRINAEGLRLVYLLMSAELDGIICSGPRLGKQFSYALLEERVPASPVAFNRQEALHELAVRYFTSHGPATVADFAWWSGLTMKDANTAVNELSSSFAAQTIGGKKYYARTFGIQPIPEQKRTLLLPAFDEYLVSYKDRSLLEPQTSSAGSERRAHLLSGNLLIRDGLATGKWAFSGKNKKSAIEIINGAVKKQAQPEIAIRRVLEFYAG